MKIELNLLCKDILNTAIDPTRARLHVILSGIRYRLRDNNNSPKIETKTILYEIVNPLKRKSNEFGKCCIIDTSVLTNASQIGHPLQNPEKLNQILESIVVEEQEELLFITWDHGNGFGIFREEDVKLPVEIEKPITNPDDLKRYEYLRMFWEKGVSALELSGLSLNEIMENDRHGDYEIIRSGHDVFKVFMNTPESLFLKKLLLQNYKTNFSILKGADGKAVLGYNNPLAINSKTDHTLSSLMPEEFKQKTIIKAELEKSDTPEVLHNHELAFVFGKWLNQKKVSVLLMMNCWLMNLHTMFSMKKSVSFLVAPQGDISIPGYNCKSILRFIYDSKQPASPIRLAMRCIRSCNERGFKRRASKVNEICKNAIDSWKIFAVDLQKMNQDGLILERHLTLLNKLIDEMIFALKKPHRESDPNELKYFFKYIRAASFDFTNNRAMMIDIVNWCIALLYANEDFSKTMLSKDKLQPALQEFVKAIKTDNLDNSIILSKTKGKFVYRYTDSENDPLRPIAVIGVEPTGYSLFFPVHQIENNIILQESIKNDLLLNHFLCKWEEFLQLCINVKFFSQPASP